MTSVLATQSFIGYWFSQQCVLPRPVARRNASRPSGRTRTTAQPAMQQPSLNREIEDLIEAHQRELLAYAARILQGPHLAHDMVQDALLKYLAARREQQTISNPRAWLYRVTHNLCLDYVRRNRRGEEKFREHADHLAPTAASQPDQGLAKEDKAAIAETLLSSLSEREQEIVRMKIYGNLSYKEIADALSITTSNVGFILHTALKKLARRARAEDLLP